MMSPTILRRDEIERLVGSIDLVSEIEQGFAAYSAGNAVIPPVGELLLDNGEVHIKYGYLLSDQYYVIKIASGFYENPALGLPSSNGMMLLFSQQTGELVSIMLDEGFLTDTRTAVAGAVAAKYLAPESVHRIGIVGTGTQARLQLQHLASVCRCRDVLVWGRGQQQLSAYREDMTNAGFSVETTEKLPDILPHCNLVVTTTPATSPLLRSQDLSGGVHITAVGSDTAEKQELESQILAEADLVVADSIEQCHSRGEIHQALSKELITREELIELGSIINGNAPRRQDDDDITVADLTGVAVQDIKITQAVFEQIE